MKRSKQTNEQMKKYSRTLFPCMHTWMDGDGGMEGWRDGGMEGWRDGGMEGWRDGGMEGWRDGWMDGWMHD